jgi:hypothetical protein
MPALVSLVDVLLGGERDGLGEDAQGQSAVIEECGEGIVHTGRNGSNGRCIRVYGQFIPTSSSWLNFVERWFRYITTDRIRRDVFSSTAQLQTAIHNYIDHNNKNPKPFVWTQYADDIIAKVNRGKGLLGTLH